MIVKSVHVVKFHLVKKLVKGVGSLLEFIVILYGQQLVIVAVFHITVDECLVTFISFRRIGWEEGDIIVSCCREYCKYLTLKL